MTAVVTRRTLLLALALLSADENLAHADNDDDDDNDDSAHNRASRAVEQGRAQPLAELLRKVQTRLGGEVIGLKLKRKNGSLIYKLKVVTPAGRLEEVSVDAMTGEIVKSEDD